MIKIPIPKSGFNLEATLDSGQVFGWTAADTMAAHCRPSPLTKKSSPPVAYSGSIQGKAMQISQVNSCLYVDGQGVKSDDIIRYFDLDFDLGSIYKILQSDEQLAASHKAFKGLRLIRQDPWEALACFIISSNNNVKRIQGIWRNLSEYYGPKKSHATFPSAKQIAKTHERTLRQLGLGYRAPFLLHSAQFISTSPQCFEMIRESGYEEAKERVLAFPGIGPKVADCVLLYGFHKLEAFPVDVWILRAIRKLYFKDRKVSEDKVHRFGQKKWGSRAGYVQQYIFHAVRNGIL